MRKSQTLLALSKNQISIPFSFSAKYEGHGKTVPQSGYNKMFEMYVAINRCTVQRCLVLW